MHALAQHGCVQPYDLDDNLWPRIRPGLGRRLREVHVTVGEGEYAIEVIYVQPDATDGADCIEFERSRGTSKATMIR